MYSRLEVINPKTLNEVVQILSDRKIKLLAGATDVMPALKKGIEPASAFLNLSNLKNELSYIIKKNNMLTIGALTTFSEIYNSSIIKKYFPLLSSVSKQIGAAQIQNRATIGGNIANASPAGDSMPVLLVYNAKLILISKKCERKISLNKFYRAYKDLELRHDEIIREIQIPIVNYSDWKSFFRKVGSRQAQTISKISFAGLARILHNRILECRIAMGSIAPIPLRLNALEEYLINKDAHSIQSNEIRKIIDYSISPIDDVRSTRKYRLDVAFNLINEFTKMF